jgi:hypothetical protein
MRHWPRALASEYGPSWWTCGAHPVDSREDLLSADLAHLAAAGQAVMAAEAVKALACVLGRPV